MVQEYLNLEEAAQVLGISKEELIQRAQRREIRAFADRGSWKFRKQDIEEHARQGGIGSGAEVVFGELDDAVEDGSSDQVLLSESSGDQSSGDQSSGDSGARVIGMDELGRTPSDSDVRLVPEGGTEEGSDSDVKLVAGGKPPSDSDVKLVPDTESDTSDSDVKIKGPAVGDSDVRLDEGQGPSRSGAPSGDATEELPAVPEMGDEELAIVSDSSEEQPSPSQEDSDFEISSGLEQDSDFELASEGTERGDSGMTLALDDQVGLPAEEAAEEAPKGPSDSDVTAQAPSSSGVNLGSPVDSGIALDAAAGSGINLSPGGGAGQGQKDLSETDFDVPALDSDDEFALSEDETADTAQLADSDFELSEVDLGAPGGTEDSGQVIALEGEEVADESEATQLGGTPVADEKWEEDLEVEEVEEAVDEPEVAEGVLPEEVTEEAAPALAPVAAAQPEWGMPWVVTLGFSAFLLLVLGVVMLDLVRTTWGWPDEILYSSPLLRFLADTAGLLP